jgi:hypothetical protein
MATLFDDQHVMKDWLVSPETHPRPHSSVLAPCCGRRTSADAVTDVRGFPAIVRAGGRTPKDCDWLCDGCRARFIRDDENAWTPSTFAKATGECPEVVKDLLVRDLVAAQLRTTPGNADVAYHVLAATLP